MQIKGSLKQIKFSDLSNGFADITVSHDDTEIPVKGHIPDYPRLTPLFIEAEFSPSGKFYSAQKITLSSDDLNRTLEFLYTFDGIGQKAAENIVKATGIDIFSYFREHDDIHIPNVSEDKTTLFTTQIKELLYKEKLYSFLFDNGADYSAITKLYHRFAGETLKKLEDNPYIYTLFGEGDFAISERLAAAKGIEEYDARRIHAIVLHAMQYNHDKGNTVIDFPSLMHIIELAGYKAKSGYITEPIFAAQELLRDDCYSVEYFEDGTPVISLKRDKICEKRIAGHIKRLYNSREKINKTGKKLRISDIENTLNITYSPVQREVLDSIRESGVYVISGGPGTGKTTLLKGILYKYHEIDPKGKIVLCSPTGAAARRMSDATGQKASTIHRLLDIKPFETDLLEYKREPIDASLIVCDETSMLDAEIAAVFLSAIKNGSTVLFIGDKDQLPSVGAGDVISDMIESGCIKTFILDHVFRQDEGSVIIDNAIKIINGNDWLTEDDNFVILEEQHDKNVADTVCRLYHQYKENDPDTDLKIFSSIRKRKFVCGTVALNCRIKEELGGDILFSYGPYKYSKDEKIVFVKNNYNKGYYNGQEGVITGAEKTARGCTVYIENADGEYSLTSSELCDIEPAYAITAHKAQGSECDVAVIAVTKEPKNMLLRKILYVEATRAKKQVIIVSERDAWSDAIRNDRRVRRDTGLVAEIRKEFADER